MASQWFFERDFNIGMPNAGSDIQTFPDYVLVHLRMKENVPPWLGRSFLGAVDFCSYDFDDNICDAHCLDFPEGQAAVKAEKKATGSFRSSRLNAALTVINELMWVGATILFRWVSVLESSFGRGGGLLKEETRDTRDLSSPSSESERGIRFGRGGKVKMWGIWGWYKGRARWNGEWRRHEGNKARGYLGLCRLGANVRPIKPNMKSNLLSVG